MQMKKYNLSKAARWGIFILFSIMTAQLTMIASFADQGLREEASTLERIYQDKSKEVLNNLLNPEDYTLVVTATLRNDEQKIKEYNEAVERRFMPGLNMNDPLGLGTDLNKLHELKQKIEIQVILSDTVPVDRESIVRDIIKAKLHLNEESGDTIAIARAQRAPASLPSLSDADKLAELTPKMIAFWVFVALLALGTIGYWLHKRKEKKKNEEDETAQASMDLATDLTDDSEEEPKIVEHVKTPEELERERDALEMRLAFAKGELIKLVKDYPSIVCRAAEEFFAQGKIQETTIYLESLGWDNSRKLFKDLDTRLWSRIGASLREREADPTLEEVFNAVHIFQRFALSFVLERAGRDSENPFSFLFHLDDSQRLDLLTHEDSFNIGLISIYSSGAQMGELLSGLSPEKQNEVLLCVTKIKHLPELHVKESVDALLMRLERIKADPFIHAEGPALAADFMRSLEPIREEELYQSLLLQHPDEAEKLRQVRILFADIPHYPTEMVRRVIESFESEDIMRALVGYPADFTENLLSLLPTKKALMIQNDLYHMAEYPPNSKCAEYRRKIVNKLETEFELQRFSISEFWKSFEQPGTAETTEIEMPDFAHEAALNEQPLTEPQNISAGPPAGAPGESTVSERTVMLDTPITFDDDETGDGNGGQAA